LQAWAFWSTVLTVVLALICGVLGFVDNRPAVGVISIVIPIIILVYLFADSKVRAAFRT
jgi:uncharacterized membrane protein YkvI